MAVIYARVDENGATVRIRDDLWAGKSPEEIEAMKTERDRRFWNVVHKELVRQYEQAQLEARK